MSDTKQRELEMLGLGANAYFSKPINPTELVHAIKSALNTRFIGKQLDDSLFKSPVPEGRRRRERVEPKSLELAADETQEAIQPFGEFGDYSLKGIIGAGGFGTVYRAVQKSLGRNVAIKVLLSEAASDRQLRERFRREAMTMARLNHPNIVQIFDMGEREHTIYIVMELVEGVSLWDAILEEGGDPFPQEVTHLVVDQLCTAVAYMHSQGVVHRDIKPRNVLVGNNGQVKLGDFGISRSSGAPALTQVHQVIGTPFYISPEVAHGAVATQQSDIYSLGLTLWTMLAGNIEAIPGETSLAAMGAHVSAEFSAALEKCYAPNPEDRYASAEIARLAFLAAMS
jgi:serine/threonine protein kinase